jgi:hypothetical protein
VKRFGGDPCEASSDHDHRWCVSGWHRQHAVLKEKHLPQILLTIRGCCRILSGRPYLEAQRKESMTRTFKSLILAGILAISALAASSASAAEFMSEGENATLNGSQVNTHTLKTTAGELTCSTVDFSASIAWRTGLSISFNLTMDGCHFVIFGSTISATVNMNGCTYTYYASGQADIVCPAGKKIVVTGAGCTVEIGAQTGKKSVSYTNNGTHIDISTNLSGISYNHSGFTCGTGSGTTGTFTGTTTLEGNKGKLWFE